MTEEEEKSESAASEPINEILFAEQDSSVSVEEEDEDDEISESVEKCFEPSTSLSKIEKEVENERKKREEQMKQSQYQSTVTQKQVKQRNAQNNSSCCILL